MGGRTGEGGSEVIPRQSARHGRGAEGGHRRRNRGYRRRGRARSVTPISMPLSLPLSLSLSIILVVVLVLHDGYAPSSDAVQPGRQVEPETARPHEVLGRAVGRAGGAVGGGRELVVGRREAVCG